MSAIRHIVLDIGNVLLRWEPDIPYRRLIPDPETRRRFLADECNGEWLRLTDSGMSWREAENILIAKFPGDAELIRAFRPHWEEMIPGEIAASRVIVEEMLAGGADVTGLTNFAADTYPIAFARFPILSRLRGVTVSAHVGLTKPDPAIYRRHAADFGLNQAATLFFDDAIANVEGARVAGWRAEHFVSPDRFRDDLRRYNVAGP